MVQNALRLMQRAGIAGWSFLAGTVVIGFCVVADDVTRSPDAGSKTQSLSVFQESLWTDLARNDTRANRALWQLVEGDADATLELFARKLKPAAQGRDAKMVARLIRELDSPKYQARERASAMLSRMGSRIGPALQSALRKTNSPEARYRLRALVSRITNEEPFSPEQRRVLRAIRILELIGTSKAETLLRRMAGGNAFSLETRRAKQALQRLARFRNRPDLKSIARMRVGRFDWPQWGGTSLRNNIPVGVKIPRSWDIKSGKNIKWKAKLGTQTYGTPAVANGKVFIGTNNGAAYLKRYPPRIDLGVLLCFDEQTGKFLWQYSSPKLAAGRVNDWPEQGMVSTPVVDGNRLWAVTNRCEVVCLDTEGFRDGKNDGPYRDEPNQNRDEADVVWKFDMMKELGVFPHNMSNCSVATAGNLLFVCTSNGVDQAHANLPSPDAPSFLCMDRRTGKIVWKDNSPGKSIVHGQWASPSYFVIGKQPQVLFPGGDGWLYSFDPRGDGRGNSKLLWKFDCNPKTSRWVLGASGTRNNLIGFACIYKGLVYIAVGQDPEHGEGAGHLWCINPTKKLDGSDVSPTLAVDKAGKPLPRRRVQTVDPSKGEREIPNPKSAAVWHYMGHDANGNGELNFEETMHRTIGTPVIQDDILVIPDFSGVCHCLDARTGRQHWTYDMFAASWGSALIVDGRIYVGDEDGDISIFPLTRDPGKALKPVNGELRPALGEVFMSNAVYTTPSVANNVLFVANKNTLFAISVDAK